VSRYQKGKTNLDFTEARDSEWQWHQLGMCKSAPRSRQITTPAPTAQFFTGRMPFLPPNQHRQSTGGATSSLQLQLQSFTLKQLFSEESCSVVGLSEKMSFQL